MYKFILTFSAVSCAHAALVQPVMDWDTNSKLASSLFEKDLPALVQSFDKARSEKITLLKRYVDQEKTTLLQQTILADLHSSKNARLSDADLHELLLYSLTTHKTNALLTLVKTGRFKIEFCQKQIAQGFIIATQKGDLKTARELLPLLNDSYLRAEALTQSLLNDIKDKKIKTQFGRELDRLRK